MILFLTTEKQSGWNKKIHEARPCAKIRVAFCASEYEYFFARHVQWTCKPSDLKDQRIGIKLANETTTSCQLVQNFIVCAVETFETLLFVQSRLSKLYCLCSRDIQNFIVCAVETFETLLFVQSRHSKLYCLCNRDIQNFIVCAVATFKTLLFVQSSHSKLFSLRVPSGVPYVTYRRICNDSTGLWLAVFFKAWDKWLYRVSEETVLISTFINCCSTEL